MTVASPDLPRNDLHIDLADDHWRQAVTQATATMDAPPYNTPKEKLQKAMDLVLAGKVEAHDDGTFTVQGSTKPYTVNGACSCPQGQNGKSKWCKHMVAVELWRRVQLRLSDCGMRDPKGHRHTSSQATSDDAPAADLSPVPQALPEAPASANVYVELAGRKVQITLRDRDEEHLLSRMEKLLARFPAEGQADTPLDPSLCVEHQQPCLRRNDVWIHKAGERDGKTVWCRRKV